MPTAPGPLDVVTFIPPVYDVATVEHGVAERRPVVALVHVAEADAALAAYLDDTGTLVYVDADAEVLPASSPRHRV